MRSEDLKERTKDFAHRCVKLSVMLPKGYLGNHIRGQMIRCATSVASNYRATCIARSRPCFISKLSIVIEEIDEACFILDEGLLARRHIEPLFIEAGELRAKFIASCKTARKTGNKNCQ